MKKWGLWQINRIARYCYLSVRLTLFLGKRVSEQISLPGLGEAVIWTCTGRKRGRFRERG